jgi:transposase
MINKFIVPYLSKAKRGFISKAPLWQVVNAVLYKFRTGTQWSLLPIKSLITKCSIKYGAVYYHFNKWAKDGSWQFALQQLVTKHMRHLDLSLAFLDATHTIAKKGGQRVGNYGKRKIKSTNTLWLTDRQGLVVAFCSPISGKHHDVFEIKRRFKSIIEWFVLVGISLDGLWLNADAAFECKAMREICFIHDIELNTPHNRRRAKGIEDEVPYFDELMYEERYKIERTNAWMDNNRTFSIRYATSTSSWNAWHCIFSIHQWVQKISKV